MVVAENANKALPQRVHVASGGSARYQRCYWHRQGRILLGGMHGVVPQIDYYDPDSGIGVLVHGLLIDPEKRVSLNADELLNSYREEGRAVLEKLDGDYLVVILDQPRNTMLVANDRMGSCPVHYHAASGYVAFGPDPWLVCALSGLRPELDEVGALEFLNLGHAVDARTLVREIRQLEPAQLLEISLATAEVICSTYWQLSFQPDGHIKERQAASDLYDALRSTVRTVKPSLSDSSQLLLTGGHDSRALLALLHQEKAIPGRALCWGVSDDIPYSDVDIASRVSAFYAVPFQYLNYDHDTFTTCAERWVRAAGLCSDNLGNFVAGPACF